MGRPKVPLLSRRAILAAALVMIDEAGHQKFSVQGLAKRLDVQGPSIYYYFPDREALLAAVGALVLERVRVPETADRDWADWIVESAVETYRAVAKHPNVAPILLDRATATASVDVFEGALAVLHRAGIKPRHGLALVDALEGIALSWVAFGRTSIPNRGFGALDAKRHPLTASAVKRRNHNEEALFREIAQALVQGFRDRHAAAVQA